MEILKKIAAFVRNNTYKISVICLALIGSGIFVFATNGAIITYLAGIPAFIIGILGVGVVLVSHLVSSLKS